MGHVDVVRLCGVTFHSARGVVECARFVFSFYNGDLHLVGVWQFVCCV